MFEVGTGGKDCDLAARPRMSESSLCLADRERESLPYSLEPAPNRYPEVGGGTISASKSVLDNPGKVFKLTPEPNAKSPRALQAVCLGASYTAYISRSPSFVTTNTLLERGWGFPGSGARAKDERVFGKFLAVTMVSS